MGMSISTIIPFADRLAAAIRAKRAPIVVGLDPRWESLPSGIRGAGAPPNWKEQATAFQSFCQQVIDVVAPLVPAVKPQAAFFEQLGPDGMIALANVIRYARSKGILVILDGKRNDIGSTATAYAEAYLGAESPFGADALTVSPYLGDDSLTPFVEASVRVGGGIFVLVKTSNPGGKTFQDLVANNRRLYRSVGALVEQMATSTCGHENYGAVGAVVGATHPLQLDELRQALPHTFFLVPGYGSQGGAAKDVAGAFDARGLGAIVNNSRGIIFAHALPQYKKFGEAQWQEAVAAATQDMIVALRSETPAGKL
jgi:orotidine-5'-phosphate decarboxylase